MSLDIYLETPQSCPHCHKTLPHGVKTLFEANITHNLTAMAAEAKIYDMLWHPEDNHVICAAQLIEPLEAALTQMKSDPPRFKKFDSPNGWGLYEDFVPWLERLLEACREYPQAEVRALS